MCAVDTRTRTGLFVVSQLSWRGEHGQEVPVVGQIFHSAAPQSRPSVLREDVLRRHLLLRLVVLQRHTRLFTG